MDPIHQLIAFTWQMVDENLPKWANRMEVVNVNVEIGKHPHDTEVWHHMIFDVKEAAAAPPPATQEHTWVPN